MAFLNFFIQHEWAYLFIICLTGLAVGSFLNVVIYRLPKMLDAQWKNDCNELNGIETEPAESFNLSTPASHCPACNHKIKPWENVPLLSWLLLKGRCSKCAASISLRYPIIEASSGLLALLVAARFGVSWETLAALLLTWSLIALSVIDFDTQLLPDDITLPTLWLGLLFSLAGIFSNPVSAIIGAAAGYLSLWTVYQIFKRLTGKEGMGYGDFKLLAMLGAWLGWQYLPQIVLLSALVGAAIGIGLIVLRGRDRNIPIPFGPYLAAAGWISLMWGEQINQAYLRWAGLT